MNVELIASMDMMPIISNIVPAFSIFPPDRILSIKGALIRSNNTIKIENIIVVNNNTTGLNRNTVLLVRHNRVKFFHF